jgi:hypothetical protein
MSIFIGGYSTNLVGRNFVEQTKSTDRLEALRPSADPTSLDVATAMVFSCVDGLMLPAKTAPAGAICVWNDSFAVIRMWRFASAFSSLLRQSHASFC